MLNIWMSPTLMANVHDNVDTTSIDAWQGFVHEYYHNHGFTHESGWASSNGIDDMFGRKVVNEYIPNLGNSSVIPDVFIADVSKVGLGTYTLSLLSNVDKTPYIRLLSTKSLNVTIEEDSSQVLKFEDIPTTDVYVSFYNDDSQQMATTIFKFHQLVSSQGSLNDFNANIGSWLQEYDIISVSTANGSWVRDFRLPTKDVDEGKVVRFNSSAGYNSYVYYDSGKYDILSSGGNYHYEFKGGTWNR